MVNADTDNRPANEFIHSVKVPIQYKTAAKILKAHLEKHQSIKHLIFKEKHAWQNRLLGLLSRIPKHKNDLDKVIAESNLLEKEPRLDQYIAFVLITELLFGSGRLIGNSKPVECIKKYESEFRELLAGNEWLVKYVEGEILQRKPIQEFKKPRYVRVNTNVISRADAIELFEKEGYTEKTLEHGTTYDQFLDVVRNLGEKEYVSDIHIKNLFVFPSSSSRYFALHPSVKEYQLILQDKASCLPAFLLNPPRGSIVLDMCAAPGMKTTHLAALLKKKGTIYAVEKNSQRYKLLNKQVQSSRSANVVMTRNEDASSLSNETVPGVQYILVDPSCSGSGMTSRMFKTAEKDAERLNGLSCYQAKLLKHAMSSFPDAQKIVYSTCSVYEEENEKVVDETLQACADWELIKPMEFAEKWKHFGSPKWKHVGKQCFYARTEIDLTDGFFVAVFQRKSNSAWNDVQATNITENDSIVGEAEETNAKAENQIQIKGNETDTSNKVIKLKKKKNEKSPQNQPLLKKKTKKRPAEISPATIEDNPSPVKKIKKKVSKL